VTSHPVSISYSTDDFGLPDSLAGELHVGVDFRLRSLEVPGTLELDADCDASVTTTTLLRDSTLDSMTSPQPAALLVDAQLEPDHGRHDVGAGSDGVQLVSTAAHMENWNDLPSDAAASSIVSDVIPEKELSWTENGSVCLEFGCDDVIPEPEVGVDRR